jgi:hypothetical protein
MTIFQFNKLSLDEKGEYTFKSLDSSFVACRKYYGQKVSLYGCDSFFIEVYFSPVENSITQIEAIEESHKNIDIYIKKMNKNQKADNIN